MKNEIILFKVDFEKVYGSAKLELVVHVMTKFNLSYEMEEMGDGVS